MAVESLPGFRCMCLGDVRFEVFDQDGGRLAVVVLHHGATLRWGQWESDAVLADGRLLLAWLDEHGMPDPVQRFEADRLRAEESAEEERNWLAAMPAGLEGPPTGSSTSPAPAACLPRIARGTHGPTPADVPRPGGAGAGPARLVRLRKRALLRPPRTRGRAWRTARQSADRRPARRPGRPASRGTARRRGRTASGGLEDPPAPEAGRGNSASSRNRWPPPPTLRNRRRQRPPTKTSGLRCAPSWQRDPTSARS